MPEWIGQVIGKVRIEKFLARGGMAEVYLGTHLTLDRPVAVKVLHSHIESDPELLARFQREARVVASLRHPNILQVFDFDTYEGHPYIVMEYLEGPSLATYLKHLHKIGQKLAFEQIGRLLGALASGIDYAHAQTAIHRDIKPANILLHSRRRVFSYNTPLTNSIEPILTDFGLARMAHSKTQTASGLVSGTPTYMSPEQARGDRVDHRTDIYSLGVVLYEMLAGRVPFEGDSAWAIIYKHIHEPPPKIEDIPAQLQDVIDRALAKDADDRYQTAGQMAADFLEGTGVHVETETVQPSQFRTSMAASPSKKQFPLWIGVGIFTVACLGILSLGAIGMSAMTFLPELRGAQANPTATKVLTLASVPNTGYSSVGILRFQNGSAAMDQITINATLDLPPENMQYEAWIVDDAHEQSRSIGVLKLNADGQFGLTFVDPQSQNLLAYTNRMEITLESNPDDSSNSSRDVIYSSVTPSGALEHIRHLLVGTEETPGQIAVAVGLVNNVTLIKEATDAMLQEFEAGDRPGMQSSAETIVNLIVGKEDPQYYIDWNNDGTINDPGDGYGLLINGDQAGYLDGMIHHSSYAAGAPKATKDIKMHAGHVEICTQNLENWTPELRDLAVSIARASENQDVEADLRKAVSLANQMLDGIDIDGNESIDPVPGEGGAMTAFEHAEYMADMPILLGEGQMPAP